MNRTITAALLLGLATLGCSDPATRDQLARVRAELDDAGRELAELGTELGDLAKLGAARLTAAVKDELSTLDGRMAEVKAGMSELGEQARVKLDHALDQVAAKRAVLDAKLAELSAESGDAAEELRAGVAAAYADLVEAVKAARQSFDQAETASGGAASGEG